MMGQWMAGFCRAMREESDQNSKEAMLDYLISLLDDANNFLCTSAKASHTQTEQIDRVRSAHAQRHVTI